MSASIPPHISLPSTSPSSAPSSGPGTPMSGMSTVAIKDGHEGSRRHNADAAAERLGRLAALGNATNQPDYFFDVDRRPDPPSTTASTSSPSDPTAAAVADGFKKNKQKQLKRQTGQTDSPSDRDGESTNSGREQREKARFVSGMTYDDTVVDTTVRTPQEVGGDEKL